MISDILYKDIKTKIVAVAPTFVYGSAEKLKPPYVIMRKISDPEQPLVFSDTQGTNGNALYSFSAYAGLTNGLQQEKFLNSVKEIVKTIRGTIGTTEKYLISSNRCGGVTLLGEGGSDGAVYGAVFDMAIEWKRI